MLIPFSMIAEAGGFFFDFIKIGDWACPRVGRRCRFLLINPDPSLRLDLQPILAAEQSAYRKRRRFMKASSRRKYVGFVAAFLLMGVILVLAGCGRIETEPRVATVERKVDSGEENQDLGIVNGTGRMSAVSKGLAHSVVAIVTESSKGRSLCTGSIIGKDLILTAAHCVDGKPSRMEIVFKSNVKKAHKTDRRPVKGYIQHPNWRESRDAGSGAAGINRGDLAVLKFTDGLPKGFAPLSLASRDLSLSIGQSVGMLGFGVTSGTTEGGAGILRKTNTKILDFVSETEVLTDGRATSVCFGDSGGPAFVKEKDKWVQWGVASSVTNRNCKQSSIHTSVVPFLSWIERAGSRL